MERVRGRRPKTGDDLAALLEALADAVESGRLDYHGDLKPEHIFVGERASVRVVDPAPRLDGRDVRAFTPEYNPYALEGPVADVFAVAAMLYRLLASVPPFDFGLRRPSKPIAAFLDAYRPVRPPRPRLRLLPRRRVPARLSGFVDAILACPPKELPTWAYAHRSAAEKLRG